MERLFELLNTLDEIYKKYDYETLCDYYKCLNDDYDDENYCEGSELPRYSEEDEASVNRITNEIDEIASGLFITCCNPNFDKMRLFAKSPLNKHGFCCKKGDSDSCGWVTGVICNKDNMVFCVYG